MWKRLQHNYLRPFFLILFLTQSNTHSLFLSLSVRFGHSFVQKIIKKNLHLMQRQNSIFAE